MRAAAESVTARVPVVSVVIPCYNQGRFLSESLASVSAQAYLDREVIVVDDGSTDDTPAVTRRFPEVRRLQQGNRGTAEARNHGLRRSRGRYVLFLDADDRLLPGALTAGVDALDRNPEYGFVYGHVRLFESGSSTCRCPTQRAVARDHYRSLLAGNYVWTPGAAMYRRAVLDAVGGFDARAGGSADFDLNIRIARRWPVHCHGQTVLDYREHPESQSGDAGYMLRSAVGVRRRHRRLLPRGSDERAALDVGILAVQGDYGERLLDRMVAEGRRGAWGVAAGCLPPLLRYYPAGLGRRIVRRLRSR
jgi:glycosyltransferase involved in cell wall biosynthesis